MMLFSLTAKAIFLVHAAYFAVTADALFNRCHCRDYCSTYTSDNVCWTTESACSVPFCLLIATSLGPFGFSYGCSPKCNSGCACNSFGCNCEGCGCSGRRDLQSAASNATDCTDYYYYMNLTLAQKVARLEELYCAPMGLTATDTMVRKLEQLTKTNASEATVTCQDFNNAYMANMTEVNSFCMNTTNLTYTKFTKSPASAPASGPTTKMSSVMGTVTFQTFLATGIVFLLHR
jgi:hypothetical protein